MARYVSFIETVATMCGYIGDLYWPSPWRCVAVVDKCKQVSLLMPRAGSKYPLYIYTY